MEGCAVLTEGGEPGRKWLVQGPDQVRRGQLFHEWSAQVQGGPRRREPLDHGFGGADPARPEAAPVGFAE